MGNDMINTLKHRNYLYYPDVASCNHPQHRLIHKLQSAGDKECLIIPFKDANNRPLLLFVVTGENLDVEGITKYIDRYSNQIKECLLWKSYLIGSIRRILILLAGSTVMDSFSAIQ